MFKSASKFNADVTNWNIQNATNLAEMFKSCSRFQGIGLSTWHVNNTTSPDTCNMSTMFNLCTDLGLNTDISIDGSTNWDFSRVTSTQSMFSGCKNLGNNANVIMNNWNLSNCTSTVLMFRQSMGYQIAASYTPLIQSFQNWTLGSGDSTNTIDCSRMFESASKFNADVTNWNIQNATNLAEMFKSCSTFQGIGLSTWHVNNATSPATCNMSSMFASCTNLGLDTDISINGAGVSSDNLEFINDNTVLINGEEVYNEYFASAIDDYWSHGAYYGFSDSKSYLMMRNSSISVENPTWLKIQYPHQVSLNYYSIRAFYRDENDIPEDFEIQGSNDDVNWTTLASNTGFTFTQYDTPHVFNNVTNKSDRFFYLRFACSKVVSGTRTTVYYVNFNVINHVYWEFSHVTSTQNMFLGCKNLGNNANVIMNNWNLENCTSMLAMFRRSFGYQNTDYWPQTQPRQQSFQNWTLGSASTSIACNSMFDNASGFNADVTNWNIQNATSLVNMFKSCSKFQGIGLSTWTISGTSADINGTDCFSGTVITNESYNGFLNALYTGFSLLTSTTATLTNTPAYYSTDGIYSRYQLTNSGWTITDSGRTGLSMNDVTIILTGLDSTSSDTLTVQENGSTLSTDDTFTLSFDPLVIQSGYTSSDISVDTSSNTTLISTQTSNADSSGTIIVYALDMYGNSVSSTITWSTQISLSITYDNVTLYHTSSSKPMSVINSDKNLRSQDYTTSSSLIEPNVTLYFEKVGSTWQFKMKLNSNDQYISNSGNAVFTQISSVSTMISDGVNSNGFFKIKNIENNKLLYHTQANERVSWNNTSYLYIGFKNKNDETFIDILNPM